MGRHKKMFSYPERTCHRNTTYQLGRSIDLETERRLFPRKILEGIKKYKSVVYSSQGSTRLLQLTAVRRDVISIALHKFKNLAVDS